MRIISQDLGISPGMSKNVKKIDGWFVVRYNADQLGIHHC